MKVAAAAFSRLALAYKTLQIQPNTTAVFDHPNSPFTQGLFVSNGCPESYLSRALDHCAEKSPKPARCYTEYLNECITLYETAGNYGSSELRVIDDFASGKVAKQYKYPAHIFAEGGDIYTYERTSSSKNYKIPRILVGTWREGIIYDMRFKFNDNSEEGGEESDLGGGGGALLPPSQSGSGGGDQSSGRRRSPSPNTQLPSDSSLYIAGHIPISREVWGLAVDPIASHVYITSGGSSSAVKYSLNKTDDGSSMSLTRLQNLSLRCNGHIIRSVNELDWDSSTGLLWGNVWFSSKIYQFNPNNGQCVGILDLHKTLELEQYYQKTQKSLSNIDAVWNGIAILDHHWIMFTGKLFKHIFIAKYN